MYRESTDRRFLKNRTALRRACIDLSLEQGFTSLKVKDIAERADVNRMTFYAHYDSPADVICEFTDSIVRDIEEQCAKYDHFDTAVFFQCATEAMYREIDFFRMVATDESCAFCRMQFRSAFEKLFKEELSRSAKQTDFEFEVVADALASGVTYAFLDWLAGKYGDASLDELIATLNSLIDAASGILASSARSESDSAAL